MERGDELCRNYTCCGLNLQDIHALVEHFEECHVVAVDPCSQLVPGQPYLASPVHSCLSCPAQAPRPQKQYQPQPHPQQHHQYPQQQRRQGSFRPDGVELDMDLCPASLSTPSPALTPVKIPLVPYTTHRVFSNASSYTPSSLSHLPSECFLPVSALDSATVLPSLASTSMSTFSHTQHDSFSSYSAYSECRAVTSPLQASRDITSASSSQPGTTHDCVPPRLPSSITPANTSSSSRVASPVVTQSETQASYHPISAQASSPVSSLHLSKPFRCPKPNCNKSYGQANGLEYHMTHGYCNFAPPEGLEASQALVAEKGVVVSGNDHSRVQIMKGDLHDVGRGAERRLRLFACGIGDCHRRYKSMDGLRYHYHHSGGHGAIGLKLLASGQHECLQLSELAVETCQSTLAHSDTMPLSCPSPRKSAGSRSWHYRQGSDQSRYSPSDVGNLPPPPAREHVPASPPVLPGKLFSDNERIPTSQSSPSRMLIPPDKLRPTLYCWIKNINKLSRLVDRLQELASSAPAEHRSQLLRQVMGLRTTFKKQQQCCMEFLTLSEEYANKYLLDISAEIQRQSSFLDKLEERLEAARKIRREAVDLQLLYESGTTATMENLRATALPRPLPEDHALFREVDLVLTKIRRCYIQLDKFWTEEISRAIEALEIRRLDPTDIERWKNFHTNLNRTIEAWKNELPSGDAQTPSRNSACSSKEADIGAIASSLSSAMSLLTSALDRLPSSNSLKYSQSGRSTIQRVYVAFAANSDLCLSLLRQCAEYGEKVIGWHIPSISLSTPLRVMASHDLRERTMRLLSEIRGVSVGNAACVQGSRKFKATYNKALSLERTMVSVLNTLLEKPSFWFMVTDSHGLPVDVLPDLLTLEDVRELSCVWAKARDSIHAALLTLASKPAPRLFYRSAFPASTRPRSVMRRWMVNLVRIS